MADADKALLVLVLSGLFCSFFGYIAGYVKRACEEKNDG